MFLRSGWENAPIVSVFSAVFRNVLFPLVPSLANDSNPRTTVFGVGRCCCWCCTLRFQPKSLIVKAGRRSFLTRKEGLADITRLGDLAVRSGDFLLIASTYTGQIRAIHTNLTPAPPRLVITRTDRDGRQFSAFLVGHSISNPNSALRLTTTSASMASANEVHAQKRRKIGF